ncbi:Elongation factor Tu [Frankliniella fusca]|uniref:Elongation factor Tu n=1 Tax=Frankliniella fusca TaxID=407009 RepID=A0AAE1HTJ4_9NEOP|nr:Elongation factor Tu [Frankliniella fusca]
MSPSAALVLMAVLALAAAAGAYDPDDAGLTTILPPAGQFEAFYPRKAFGQPNGSARSAHAHGSYYAHRHAALVDAPNAAAYGFR